MHFASRYFLLASAALGLLWCSTQALGQRTITTVAGNGGHDFVGDGGPAVNASLNQPQNIALDKAGNLYIADTDHNTVRRVDARTGIITTVAGSFVQPFDLPDKVGDGLPATSAFLEPFGVAVDAVGNIFIADIFLSDHAVRRVDAFTGLISTPLVLPNPCPFVTNLAFDSIGNLFLIGANAIWRRDTFGGLQVVAGTPNCFFGGFGGDGGPATSAFLNAPRNIAFDAADNLFIADSGNHRIRRVDAATGVITTVAGSFLGFGGDGGPAISAQLLLPMGVAIDGSGNVLIADTCNQRIRKVDVKTGVITTIAGVGPPLSCFNLFNGNFGGDGGPAISALLDFPTGVAVDRSDNIFVVDQANQRIRRINADCSINPKTQFFQQFVTPPPPPFTTRTAVLSLPPISTPPPHVPAYFGMLPNTNPLGTDAFVFCPTKKSGCALTTAASMLTSFDALSTMTPTQLNSQLTNVFGYDVDKIQLCPLGQNDCAKSQLTSFSDWCELDWGVLEDAAPSVVRMVDSFDVTPTTFVDNQYLDDHVCKQQDRVVLKLQEFVDGAFAGSHYVLIKAKSPQADGSVDWTVFDPGWSVTIPGQGLTSLNGHIGGFKANGSNRTFKISGVRAYADVSGPGSPGGANGSISITANSPVELLMIDPQNRRLGNLGGADVFDIPRGSYIRETGFADDDDSGIATSDATGIKTVHVPFPQTGTYDIQATGTALGMYTLRVHAISSDGTVQVNSLSGITSTRTTTTYALSFSPVPSLATEIKRVVTFESTLQDIDNAYQIGLIDNQGVANSLAQKITNASVAVVSNRLGLLRAFSDEIAAQSSSHISGVAIAILREDAKSLLAAGGQ